MLLDLSDLLQVRLTRELKEADHALTGSCGP